MAGILDWVGSGLLPSRPSDWNGAAPKQIPDDWKDAANYLWQLDRLTAQNPLSGGQTFAIDRAQQQPDMFAQRFGAFQPPAQQPMPSAPQMQQPAQAQQAFGMPSGSFAMGNQSFPMFGQAQQDNAQLPPNAQPTAGRAPVAVPNNPQAEAPSFQSELLGAAPKSGFLDKLIGAFDSPAAYDAKNAQRETARGLYEIYRGQGTTPNEAASRAVIEARNPAIMAERMKPYPTMEARLANQPDSKMAPGGNAWQTALKWKADNKATEVAAEKQAGTQAEAQINLPGALADSKETLRLLEDFKNHPGTKSMFWGNAIGANIPNPKGTQSFGAERLMEQIKARNFGDQVKTMVGMGALSNAEGMKITDAVNRLDRGLPEADRNQAINDIIVSMRNGIDKLHQKAGEATPFGFQGAGGWQNLPGGVKIRPKQ